MVIIKKIEGKINRINGKLLEDAFADYLEHLKLFDKVVKNGANGEFDVIAYKGKILFVFSLKNIKVDKRHYNKIPVDKFYPELIFAREQQEKNNMNVYCYLAINDKLIDTFFLKPIDLSFPSNPIKIV